ncbi:MAG: hypothetical protein LBE84_06205 [Planctomycetota bacterium]|nr:hypothetical protein [Planctomycetota bacterium]
MNEGKEPAGGRREHLGIHFRCCNVYGYIYKNKAGTAYCGFCPRCLARVEVKISRDGTGSGQRIFQAE